MTHTTSVLHCSLQCVRTSANPKPIQAGRAAHAYTVKKPVSVQWTTLLVFSHKNNKRQGMRFTGCLISFPNDCVSSFESNLWSWILWPALLFAQRCVISLVNACILLDSRNHATLTALLIPSVISASTATLTALLIASVISASTATLTALLLALSISPFTGSQLHKLLY